MSETRETELVSLWLWNDQGIYGLMLEMAEDADDEYELASALESWAEDTLPELEGWASDLLTLAFSRVDWLSIATDVLEHANAGES